MKANKIFRGNIMKCDKYIMHEGSMGPDLGHIEREASLYKANAVLLKTKHGYYVDIESMNFMDIIYMSLENKNGRYNGEFNNYLGTSALFEGNIFVDEKSLCQYQLEKEDSISLHSVQKSLGKFK